MRTLMALRSRCLATSIALLKSFRGKVFFPVTYDKYIRIIIPVGHNDFALDFRWANGKEERKLKRAY